MWKMWYAVDYALDGRLIKTTNNFGVRYNKLEHKKKGPYILDENNKFSLYDMHEFCGSRRFINKFDTLDDAFKALEEFVGIN